MLAIFTPVCESLNEPVLLLMVHARSCVCALYVTDTLTGTPEWKKAEVLFVNAPLVPPLMA